MKDNSDINVFKEKKEFYNPEYKWALNLIDEQNNVFWRFNETNIENDYGDLHNKLTGAETVGIQEALKIFTLYEIDVGNDYWGGVVKRVFKHPELKMLATTNSYYEVVHARAYNEINRCMGLDTKEFYTEYKQDGVLSERMKFLEDSCNIPKDYNAMDVLKSLATFLFIEGAVLYTSFAYIKHFSANGKNLMKNTNAAIDYSIRDEGNFHVTSTEMYFKTLLFEAELDIDELAELQAHVYKVARKTYEHEEKIILKLFKGGEVDGISEIQLHKFIKTRINECLICLEYDPLYAETDDNPIKDWFYDNISTLKLTDFFFKQSAQYSRNWTRTKFKWN